MATVTDVLNRCLRRLREAANSTAIQLDSGVNSTPTLASGVSFLELLNDATAEIARSCYPVPGDGTVSWAASTPSKLLTDLTITGTAGTLWEPLNVRFGASVFLEEMGGDVLQSRYGGGRLATAGTPQFWAKVGQDARGIALYPTPSTGPTTVAVEGWLIPPRLANVGDTVAFVATDELRALETRLCAEIAAMNLDDEGLAARAPVWWGDYEAWRGVRYDRLDWGTRTRLGPLIPHPMASVGGSGKKAR